MNKHFQKYFGILPSSVYVCIYFQIVVNTKVTIKNIFYFLVPTSFQNMMEN